MSKFSAGMNSDLGNGFFWVEIPDAKHVDQCNTISSKRHATFLREKLRGFDKRTLLSIRLCTFSVLFFSESNVYDVRLFLAMLARFDCIN